MHGAHKINEILLSQGHIGYRAFGKPVGTAARVHPGEIIMVGKVDRGSAKTMKEALKKASIKLPTPCNHCNNTQYNEYICQSSSNCG